MPLDARTIAVKIAIGCLFLVALIGWYCDLEPLVCCKRAVIGAVVVYILSAAAVGIVNQILIGAYIKSRIHEQKDTMSERSS